MSEGRKRSKAADDLAFRIRVLSRQVTAGELGPISDAVVLFKRANGVELHQFGDQQKETCAAMLKEGMHRMDRIAAGRRL